MAAIEFARNVLDIPHAHSTEMDAHTCDAVIDMMAEQKEKLRLKGGTMRLGAYPCEIKQDSLAYSIYNKIIDN